VRAEAALARAALTGLVAAAVAGGPARGAEVEPPGALGDRAVSTLSVREAVLVHQADGARAEVRWRLGALYRLVVAGQAFPAATRARALDAGTRVLARELAEARSVGGERDQLRAQRATLAAVAGGEEGIGVPPIFAMPVPGSVLARFGVAPERDTGALVPRAGLRLAAGRLAPVKAPAAGRVALVASEREGRAVMLDHGAGWMTIVGGLAAVRVAEGEGVAAGQCLGAAAAGVGVTFEVWRGRRPVDPLPLVRPVSAPRGARGSRRRAVD
jgi:murein DD-endopeptidase MepM/ murein hydrolase activator NlpD